MIPSTPQITAWQSGEELSCNLFFYHTTTWMLNQEAAMNVKVQRQFLVKHQHLHAVGIIWTSSDCKMRFIFSQKTTAVWLRSSCDTHSVKGEKIWNTDFPQTWLDTSMKITSNWRRRKQEWKVWAFSYILTAYNYLPFKQSSDLNDRAQLL